MLWQRVLSGVIGIPLALFLIYQGGILFSASILILSLIGIHEFLSTLEKAGIRVVKEAAFPIVAIVVFTPHLLPMSDLGLFYAIMILVLVAGVLAFCVVVPPDDSTRSLVGNPRFQSGSVLTAGSTVLAVLYVSLFAFFVMMRKLKETPPAGFLQDWEGGAKLFLLILIVTWSVDAGAYAVGKTIGKRKLAPRVSPGKSVEGSIGGWIIGVMVCIACAQALGFHAPHGAALGCVLGISGQLGDLCKSVIKRDVGVKDFGNVIPGHGGVLDRFDSLLFNVPLGYLYAVAWMGLS